MADDLKNIGDDADRRIQFNQEYELGLQSEKLEAPGATATVSSSVDVGVTERPISSAIAAVNQTLDDCTEP